MRFPIGFFEVLVVGAVLLATAGAIALGALFVVDAIRKKLW